MYIYRGKFNWEASFSSSYATDEPFTIVFPSDFDLGEDAFASWTYWDKSQVILTGSIDKVTPIRNTIGLFYNGTEFESIWINITFPEDDPDRTTLVANVYHSFRDIDTYPNPSTMTLVYQLDDSYDRRTDALLTFPISRIYYGTLTTSNSEAVDELFVLVIPHNVLASQPLCAYWMWTDDETNVDISGLISSLDGKTFSFTESSGAYQISGDDDGTESGMVVTLIYGGDSTKIDLELVVTPSINDLVTALATKGQAKNMVSRRPPPKIHPPASMKSTPGRTTGVWNDLPEPVWCTIYEGEGPAPSTFSAWAGLALSVIGFNPTLSPGYAMTVGALTLVLSGLGVYDAKRAGPDMAEADMLYQNEVMYRVAQHRPKANQTTNAATFIRVHVEGQTKLVITHAVKSLLPNNVYTSNIFSDSSITTELFSIVMDNTFELLSFRVFVIIGLVPLQATGTLDNSWFKEPAAVSFVRGEMATVDISTSDRKTLTRYGALSVAYDDDVSIFKFSPSTVFLCVEDKQTLLADGYDFFLVSNTDNLRFLRLGACTVGSVSAKIEIGFVDDQDSLRGLISVKYREYELYWIEQRTEPDTEEDMDFLCAGRFNSDSFIQATPSKPNCKVLIKVANWHSELRMSRLSSS